MDSKPFKFRYIDKIVGAFLFFVVGIVAILITLGAKSQQWFSEVTVYRVELPGIHEGSSSRDGTRGIRPGSDVRVIGSQVGHVKRVDLCTGKDLVPVDSFDGVDPGQIRIVAVLEVKGDFSKFIGPDSEAVLKFDLGGLGSSYFDITRGSTTFPPRSPYDPPYLLKYAREPDAKEEVFEVVKRIEEEVVPAIKEIKGTAESATLLFDTLNDRNEVFYRSLVSLEEGIADLNDLIDRANSGDGVLGDFINSDTQMRKDFNEFADTINRSSTDLELAIKNLDDGITELREGGVLSFNEAAEDFPTTIQLTNTTIANINRAAIQLNEVLREFEILTEAAQKNFLVRKNVVDPIEDPIQQRQSQGRQNSSRDNDGGNDGQQQGGLLKKIFGKKSNQ